MRQQGLWRGRGPDVLGVVGLADVCQQGHEPDWLQGQGQAHGQGPGGPLRLGLAWRELWQCGRGSYVLERIGAIHLGQGPMMNLIQRGQGPKMMVLIQPGQGQGPVACF